MKKIITAFLLLMFTTLTYAQKAHVLILDDDIKSKELEDNFKIHRGSTHVSSIPDLDARDELLEGIDATLDWDELKKDIFFMDLKSKTLAELEAKYPELKKKELKNLQEKRQE